MQEHAKKPAIRFKGFTDDWEQRKVTELGKVFIGLVTTMTRNYRDEGTLLIRNSDIKDGRFEFSDSVIYLDKDFANQNRSRMHQIGDVVTVHTGDVGTSAVISEKENKSLGFATIVTRPNLKLITSDYLCTFLNTDKHKKWAVSVSTGDGRTNYNLGDYFELIIPITSIEEQKKIALFMKKISNLITLHQRKHDKLVNIKKAMLEKMFPKDGAKVPEIRFKGFTDAWEQRKLGEIAERVVRKNTELQSTLPLTISAQYGLVDQITYFNNRVASNNIRGYYLIKNGEFAYNKSSSDGYPFGAVKRLDYYPMGVLSTLYIVFSIKSDVSSQFLVSYYDTNNWHKEVAERAAEGARNHGLLNISADDFLDTELKLPREVIEQEKIGELLKNLDRLITLHQRKLEKLQNLKQACLEKLFV